MTNFIGFTTLIEREMYRFMRLFNQTVVPPLVTTVLYILIFGYSLGSRIHEIHGFSYIVYILPGLIQMSVINNAYANSSTSLFMSRLERSIENMLVAPLNYFYMVTSIMVGGLVRGIVVGLAVYLGSLPFVHYPMAHPMIIIFTLVLTSILFSGLGILSGLWAETWDKIAVITNFVITPFVYLGGVFYSIQMLPPFWQKVSHGNPIFYCIDLMRYGFLGVADTSPVMGLTTLAVLAFGVYGFCVYLFKKGFKIMR